MATLSPGRGTSTTTSRRAAADKQIGHSNVGATNGILIPHNAARRAGININRVYLTVFILCSLPAAVAGVLFIGQLGAARGTQRVHLNAIAAAVIGGTSLFGGRGGAYAALLGVIVIEAINNGLVLLSLTSAVQFIITGGVLMVAVIVDSLAQKRRTAHGVG